MLKKILSIILLPLIVILSILLGMVINKALNPRFTASDINNALLSSSKLDIISKMINYSYVDSVDMNKIEEDAIAGLIKSLDPHTVYIPKKDMEKTNEEIVGNFGGIGVQFYKYQDTVTVVRVVEGGPSEKAGIYDGDRIIRVNDSLIIGKDTDKIMSMMRGQIDTEINLTIVRRGVEKPIIKNLTRGSIPIKSVTVAYMINDTTGIIKVNTFGMNTYNEFMHALEELQQQNMKKLIVDLRENGGGILPIAIRMINEFLPEDRLIVYTQGKAIPRMDYKSNGKGQYQDLPLTVLINDFSASASEIFAGAIQDNDRGLVIGRRSFGKGLVQEQRELYDGSAIRLTVARYYIPSGRCIQKPYNDGKEAYQNEILNRFMHGEFTEKDSINFDESLKYKTISGRAVYGGGGVMPDIFIPADTLGYSNYYSQVLSRTQTLYEYTFYFMDHHRNEMKNIRDYKELLKYLTKYNLVEDFVNYASKKGIKRNNKEIKASYRLIDNSIKAFIGRHVLDDKGFYPIFFMTDATVERAKEAGN